MTVTLFPPITSSSGHTRGQTALTEGPRFVRTRAMSRWHRPRSGVRRDDGRITYHLWCGGGFVTGEFLARDEPLPGEAVCGPCDGRAVGAGQEQNGPAGRHLVFTPRWSTKPAQCPGARIHGAYRDLGSGRVGECLVCGDILPVRMKGGPYNGYVALASHRPAEGLVQPCPFHAWQHLAITGGKVQCWPCERELNR